MNHHRSTKGCRATKEGCLLMCLDTTVNTILRWLTCSLQRPRSQLQMNSLKSVASRCLCLRLQLQSWNWLVHLQINWADNTNRILIRFTVKQWLNVIKWTKKTKRSTMILKFPLKTCQSPTPKTLLS